MSALPYGIQRVGFRKIPHVPTNTERLQRFRLSLPVVFANTTFNGGGVRSRDTPRLLNPGEHHGRPTLPASTPLPRRKARNQQVSVK